METRLGADIVTYITPICPKCRKRSTLQLKWNEIVAYKRGALIQDAFTTLTRAERELIKTGIHPECWIQIFGEED